MVADGAGLPPDERHRANAPTRIEASETSLLASVQGNGSGSTTLGLGLTNGGYGAGVGLGAGACSLTGRVQPYKTGDG